MRWWVAAALALGACESGSLSLGADRDGDGWGAEVDCDDDDPAVHPEADEHCDGIDEDCDGVADDDPVDGLDLYSDADSDGYGDPHTPGTACAEGGGWTSDATDCDDGRAAVHPGAEEVCDGLDNDCDGEVDLDVTDGVTWYRDLDGDGHGDPGDTLEACEPPPGHVAAGDDCDDMDSTVYPGAPEACDGVDADCEGLGWLEEDSDRDGLPACAEALWYATDDSGTSSPYDDGDYGSSDAENLLEERGVTSSLVAASGVNLTASILQRQALIVLYGRGVYGLSRQEAERLQTWVSNGGSLFLFTGWETQDSCDLAELPDLGLGCGRAGGWTGTAQPLGTHPVTDGIIEACGRGADRWVVNPPAQVIVDGDWPLVVASEHGEGRVVALSDEWPLYNHGTGECDLSDLDHEELVDNAWAWLTEYDL